MHELTGYLRPFDLVTSIGVNKILVLMPEIKRREMEKYLDVFQYNLQKIISDNIQEQQELIEIKVVDVNNELDLFAL